MENEINLGWEDTTTFNHCREKLDGLVDNSKHGQPKKQHQFKIIWNWIKSGHINMKVAYALIEYVG